MELEKRGSVGVLISVALFFEDLNDEWVGGWFRGAGVRVAVCELVGR